MTELVAWTTPAETRKVICDSIPTCFYNEYIERVHVCSRRGAEVHGHMHAHAQVNDERSVRTPGEHS